MSNESPAHFPFDPKPGTVDAAIHRCTCAVLSPDAPAVSRWGVGFGGYKLDNWPMAHKRQDHFYVV